MPLTHRRGCAVAALSSLHPQQHMGHGDSSIQGIPERATTKGGVSSLQLAEAAAPCLPCRPASPTIQCHLTGGDACSHHGLTTRILAYNTEARTLIKPLTERELQAAVALPASCSTSSMSHTCFNNVLQFPRYNRPHTSPQPTQTTAGSAKSSLPTHKLTWRHTAPAYRERCTAHFPHPMHPRASVRALVCHLGL